MRVPERSTTKYYFIQYFFRYVQVAVYKLWVSIQHEAEYEHSITLDGMLVRLRQTPSIFARLP